MIAGVRYSGQWEGFVLLVASLHRDDDQKAMGISSGAPNHEGEVRPLGLRVEAKRARKQHAWTRTIFHFHAVGRARVSFTIRSGV